MYTGFPGAFLRNDLGLSSTAVILACCARVSFLALASPRLKLRRLCSFSPPNNCRVTLRSIEALVFGSASSSSVSRDISSAVSLVISSTLLCVGVAGAVVPCAAFSPSAVAGGSTLGPVASDGLWRPSEAFSMIPLTLEVALSTAEEIVLGASSVPFLWASLASARSSLLMVFSRVDLASSSSLYSLATLAVGLELRPVTGSIIRICSGRPAALFVRSVSISVIAEKSRIWSSVLNRVRYCSLGVSRENRPPELSASNRSFIEVTNLPKTDRMVKAFIGSLGCRLFRECSGRLAASLGVDATLAASIAVDVVRAAELMSTTVGSTPLDTAVWIVPAIGS